MKITQNITLEMELATGKVTLNEIVYRLKELRDALMLEILEKTLMVYDDEIVSRLRFSGMNTSARKGLGRHLRKDNEDECFCRGRKVISKGYRSKPRHISTVFGTLKLRIRVVKCCTCGAWYSPLLNALQIGRYARREDNFEHEVIEAVIDTNYRRLIDGRSIDISLGGIHNVVVENDIDRLFQEPVSVEGLSALMGDGTGLKQVKGRKGELRAAIGITESGSVFPLGCFANTPWPEIEQMVKRRFKEDGPYDIPFIYDGEPGLDDFLADVAESQRCTWHAPRGLYHALWEDGLKKKDSQPTTDKLKGLIGIALPEGDYELLKEEDKDKVKEQYQTSKSEIDKLIQTFKEKGYSKGANYLKNLSERLFTHVKLWLKTGVIAPKTTSLLERLFREIGRRLKKIAWGWSDKVATNLMKMIVIRQYSRADWEKYWKEKLGILGYFRVGLVSVKVDNVVSDFQPGGTF